MTHQTHLTRLPFAAGSGPIRFCVAGAMTDDADADFKWTVVSLDVKVAV